VLKQFKETGQFKRQECTVPIEELLGTTVGPLCVARRAQRELEALLNTGLALQTHRRHLFGSQFFVRGYGMALGSTRADAWLIMEGLDHVSPFESVFITCELAASGATRCTVQELPAAQAPNTDPETDLGTPASTCLALLAV
jgi:hypothetical protein